MRNMMILIHKQFKTNVHFKYLKVYIFEDISEYFQSTNENQDCWAGAEKSFYCLNLELSSLKFSQVQMCNYAN